MYWIVLFVAGLFEVAWAVGLKMTEGFTKLAPSIFTIIGTILSFVCLSIAMKKIPLSIAYAIWTGIGIAGTVLFGAFYFHESISLQQIICIIFIIGGIVGLRLVS